MVFAMKKKSIILLSVVAGAAVLTIVAALLMMFTDVFSGKSGGKGISELSAEVSAPPSAAVTAPSGTPAAQDSSTPSPVSPPPSADTETTQESTSESSSPPSPVSAEPTIPGSGGDVVVNAETFFEFTPDKTGIWEFKTWDNGDSDPFLDISTREDHYVALDDDSAGDLNAFISVNLTAGETYIVNAGYSAATSGKYMLSVTYGLGSAGVDPDPTYPLSSWADEIIPGEGGVFLINGDTTFEFTPDLSEIWTFETTDCGEYDPYLVLFDSNFDIIAENDDGYIDLNSYIQEYLYEGETYFLIAGFYSDAGTYTLTVRLFDYGDSYYDIPPSMSSSETGIPDNGGVIYVTDTTTYEFTPDRDGYWSFETGDSGDSDPFLTVYDPRSGYATTDDDGSENGELDALIIMYLYAGTTYIVTADFYGSGTGGYYLVVWYEGA